MSTIITRELVENEIDTNPGITQVGIAKKHPTGDKKYGSHKFVASHVAAMRREGLLEDVPRCEKCNGALTRGNRNVPLYLKK